MNELKRCPFCGSEEVGLIEAKMYFVMCHSCGANGGARATHKDAVAAWDERAVDPRLEDDGK